MDQTVQRLNFRTNMSAAIQTCADQHANGTLPYYQCLCSGLQDAHFIRAKYYFCKKASILEKEESSEAMKEVGETIGMVLGIAVLITLLVVLYRRFKVQIGSCLSAAFASVGLKQHYESCSRMFCVCCQKHPKQRLGDVPANQNLSGRPSSRCGKCCYSDAFLAVMEFICDCDCFRTRRAPKYVVPILGRQKARSESASSGGEPEEVVEMQPPRRMRSVRKAPPPPRGGATAPVLPEAPAFDPQHRMGSMKRRAPEPPRPHQPYQPPPPHNPYQPPQQAYQPPPQAYQPPPQPYQPPPQAYQPPQPYQPPPQAYQPPQPYQPPPQVYQPSAASQPPPQPYQPPPQVYQPSAASQGPPRYADLYQQAAAPEPAPLSRGGPLRVSKEFQQQLNQTVAGMRRYPSESEI